MYVCVCVCGKLCNFTIYNELEVLLNGNQNAEICHSVLEAENFIQYVRKLEITEPTAFNKREGFNFLYFPLI